MEGNNNKRQLYTQVRLKRTVLDLNIMDTMCTYQNMIIMTSKEFRFSTVDTINMGNMVIILSMGKHSRAPKFSM